MTALATSSSDIAYLALSVFLLATGLAIAYAFVRLGGTLGRLSAFIKGTQEEILPVINKVGGSVDRVNGQLDKVDVMTDSAVDAVDSVDTAIRAVSFAIQRPVTKASGFAAGLSHGFADFRVHHDVRGAVAAGKVAAVRRQQELADELREADRTA
ncbi:MAG: hypothetical protein ACM33B_01650 [Pseudomonadota bacterium]